MDVIVNAEITLGNGVIVRQEGYVIRFYFDGREFGSVPWNDPMAGQVIIGYGTMVPVMAEDGRMVLETQQTANRDSVEFNNYCTEIERQEMESMQ